MRSSSPVPAVALPAVVEECEITKLLAVIDMKTKEKKKVGGGRRGGRGRFLRLL